MFGLWEVIRGGNKYDQAFSERSRLECSEMDTKVDAATREMNCAANVLDLLPLSQSDEVFPR